MTCRGCGTTIADKAIVCYKCGRPTAELQPRVSSQSPNRLFPVLFLIAAAATGLGAWLIPKTPEGTWMRWAAWVAVPAVVFLAVRLIRGPRSR